MSRPLDSSVTTQAHANAGFQPMRLPWIRFVIQVARPGWLSLTLAAVGTGLVVGMITVSGWDSEQWALVHQHLFGEVKLSTGMHSARSLEDLNQLSWSNGLDVIDTLDQMNTELDAYAASHHAALSAPQQHKLLALSNKLNHLLADHKTLVNVALRFHTSHLFSPEYDQYLTDTRSRLQVLETTNKTASKPDFS